VAGIDIQGNKVISTATIQAVIGSKVGGPYSETQVTADRDEIAKLGWFRRVLVDRENVESGVKLVFRVVENPVVTAVQFEGLREVKPQELLAVMETKPGTVFNWKTWRQDGEAIYKLYRERGFILATLFDPSMSDAGVLTVTVAEGVIEDIKIAGNTYTKTYVIRRYIRTKPGDTYNDNKVKADVVRLTNLDYFDTVSRDAEMGSEPGKVVVVYTMVEKKHTGLASVGGGYSSVQGIVGFVDLSKNNLRGTGQMVAIRGEFGGRTSYELGYRNPWIMTPETRMSLGIYDRLTVREAFLTTPEGQTRGILYDERRSGGNVTFGRPRADRKIVYLGLRSDDVSLVNLTEEEKSLLNAPAFQPRRVRSLSLAQVTDYRDDQRNPRHGSYQQLSAEWAGLLGGARFSKYTMDLRRFVPVGSQRVIAMRLLGGTITGDAPYLEQFLIGGTESLRGFRSDRFAGSHMAIMNTEYRWPLTKNLTGVLFVDAGDAWGGSIANDLFFQGDKNFALHVGYGVGVRVQTQIGTLRLDLGFSDEGTETHFGVAHMF
jgi:outer membrane protein insertion porin family